MNAPSQSKPSAILVGGLIALGVIASLVTALATSDGPSANPDSVSYLRMAAGLDPIEHPLGHFPPGYPLALRGLHGLGSGWIGAGRWLGISLAGLNAVLAGLVSWRIFRSNGWAFATAIALASATTLAPLNVGLFSEPLFFTLIFAWLLLIDATRSALLVVCGIVAAASFLVRFAGVSLLLASVALLWSTPRRLLLFAAGAAPPLLFWALTRPISAEVESRPLVWHPPPPHALAVGVARTTEWISGETGTFWSGCLILIVAVFLLWRAWQSANSRRLAVVAGCYVIVLALTMTLFYAQTPLDPRLLAPVQVLVLVSAPVVSHIRPRRFAIGGGCAVVALNIFATWGALRPIDQSMLGLHRSPTIIAAAQLHVALASNAPAALWLLNGQTAAWIPKSINPYTRQAMPNLDNALTELRRTFAGGGLLVWLNFYNYRAYLPSETEAVSALGAVLIERYADGAIYEIGT